MSNQIKRYLNAKKALAACVVSSKSYLVFENGKFTGLKAGESILLGFDGAIELYFDSDKPTTMQFVEVPNAIQVTI